MALRNEPCVPLTTAAIINIKQQGGGYDNDKNFGNAITYGRVFLQQPPRTLRRVVVVGLTDLLSITLIIVRLDFIDGSEHLSFDVFPRLSDVKYTLLPLLSSEPQRLFVELPDLGASIQVVGLLGFGAKSHVYKVVEGARATGNVLNSLLCGTTSKECLFHNRNFTRHKISICHDSIQFGLWVSSTRLAGRAILLAARLYATNSEDALTRWVCVGLYAGLCMEECVLYAEICHICQMFRSSPTMAEPFSQCVLGLLGCRQGAIPSSKPFEGVRSLAILARHCWYPQLVA